MTREEQISQASYDWTGEYTNSEFHWGAEWADKHPFLDEVKEMDLNAAVEDYIDQHKSELHGYFDIRRIARHFYVLGLNARSRTGTP